MRFPTVARFVLIAAALASAAAQQPQAAATATAEPPRITRPARAWEFLPAVGRRAAFFGNEAGDFEGWVYPMKFFRELQLTFRTAEAEFPAASLARSIEVTPEAASIRYTGDTFTVLQTFFVPEEESGGVIVLEVEARQPLEITASFRRDFQLMWPAGLAATYVNWNDELKAFSFGEEQRRFFGLLGSPSAQSHAREYFNIYAADAKSSLRLKTIPAGRSTHLLVLAGSTASQAEAEQTYRRLAAEHQALRRKAADGYRDYLAASVALRLPDKQLESAYRWAMVSMRQGVVTNPYLGTGLIAGYRTSGAEARPGFAWFFGRDALWTAFALNAAGDFATVRTALEFLIKYQRNDGKIPHEIAQGANFVPWFEKYPYGFAAADATPLFVLTVEDYVRRSGDVEFARRHWGSVWKAFQFLRSTIDDSGFPRNLGVGHGWVEGGPLLPVKTELYQAGLGVEALRAVERLAALAGQGPQTAPLQGKYAAERERLNREFWIPAAKSFAFALDEQGKQVNVPSVLATVPMWFEVLDAEKADAMITQLAGSDHLADWGTRILSSSHPLYDPSGYHFGSVWPLFTGWAAVGQYRYHRAHPAYANLAANALLGLDGSAGHVTEVLSGSYYATHSTSSPHQIWSAAMVVSPLLRGMMGLEADAQGKRLRFAPHVPADWTGFEVSNIALGEARTSLRYEYSGSAIRLEINTANAVAGSTFEFSPAISSRARVTAVLLDGKPARHRITRSPADQHPEIHVPLLPGVHRIEVRVQDDFGVHVPASLPELGAPSGNIKLVEEQWADGGQSVTLRFSGIAGRAYTLPLRAASGASAQGAEIVSTADGKQALRVVIPQSGNAAGEYVKHEVVLRFRRP